MVENIVREKGFYFSYEYDLSRSAQSILLELKGQNEESK